MPTVTIAITSGTRWRVPADCKEATVEVIGAGGVGGGAYSKVVFSGANALTPLSYIWVNVATPGGGSSSTAGDTWFNKSFNGAPSSTTDGVLATAGTISYVAGTVLGGQASDGVGTTKYSGGAGWGNTTLYTADSYGGAAGPNGNGGDGYQGSGKGGGGGANGGGNGRAESGGAGGAGGTNRSGASGSGSGGSGVLSGTAGAGSVDPIWTDYRGTTYGPAGGNGGTSSPAYAYSYPCGCGCATGYAGNPYAVNYGGGGLWASQGLIIVTYTPQVSIGTTYTEVFNEYGYTSGNFYAYNSAGYDLRRKWRIPYGVESITIHCIGAGGVDGSYAATPAGGGGAYASTTLSIVDADVNTEATYALNTNYTNRGAGEYRGPVWFSKTSVAPTSTTQGVLAACGSPGGSNYENSTPGAGGQAGNSIGTTKYSGGSGGTTRGTTSKKGGGGGAAGPNGAGGNGGSAFNNTSGGAGAGGGGANGGSNGNSVSSNTVAAAGGTNRFGSGGGAAGTSTVTAGSGSGGGGGGGGASTKIGGRGSYEAIWTDSGTGTTYGPGGGGGGAGSSYSGGGGESTVPYYGGGSGYAANATYSSYPLLVLQYTMTKAVPSDAATGNMFMMFQ